MSVIDLLTMDECDKCVHTWMSVIDLLNTFSMINTFKLDESDRQMWMSLIYVSALDEHDKYVCIRWVWLICSHWMIVIHVLTLDEWWICAHWMSAINVSTLNKCYICVCAIWTWYMCLQWVSVINMFTLDEYDKKVHTGWVW